MKSIFEEFKTFALRGNVMDMAVGIIIGGAFGKIVDSLVKDVLMPPLGLLLGRVDFKNLFFTLSDGQSSGPYLTLEAAQSAGAVTLNVGLFINTIISFVIVAFAVFMLIKTLNRLHIMTVGAASTKICPYCGTSIPLIAVKCPNCISELK